MPVHRPTYAGHSRQLLLAFDVGTTFSGISYCLLDPGEVPQIQGVTRFPAQEHLGGNSKIPSLIYYNKNGEVEAIGAEARDVESTDHKDWYILQWWKLLMAPKELVEGLDTLSPPPLPPNKSIVDVFSDFLAYLFRCTEQFIIDSHAGGSRLWDSVRPGIQFILTHPNGWEGAQQSLMRHAAIRAGLVPDTEDGRSRIMFVTEGEASFNYCAVNSLSADAFKANRNILVIDAGGGTVDISAYSITSSSPLSVEELFPPDCLMQGSEFVTFRATDYIREKLDSSEFGTPDDLYNITTSFDTSVKRLFKDREEPVYIKFGTLRDKDAARGISGGKLKLSGTEIASFFEECVDSIVSTVRRHVCDLIYGSTEVFLVGGFAASPWLFKQLQEAFQPLGLTLSRPDGHTNKAVADGAISFYLDHFVSTRVAKYTYGTSCTTRFNLQNNEHRKRRDTVYESLSGAMVVPNAFSSILLKDVKVSSTEEFSVNMNFTLRPTCSRISTEISRYKGSRQSPSWMDVEPNMFSTLCYIDADISAVPKVIKRNQHGVSYFEQRARIVLLFGSTELKAQLCWDQDGEEKRSPAKIIYDLEDD